MSVKNPDFLAFHMKFKIFLLSSVVFLGLSYTSSNASEGNPMKQKNFMELISGAANLFKKAFVHREIGVGALIVESNKVLLVEHTYKKGWSIVGGGIDPGEAPAEAAAREVYEEVGVKVKSPPEILHLYHWSSKKKDSYTAVYLCADFDIEEGGRSFEIKQSKWFDLDDLPKNLNTFSKDIIKKYKEKTKKYS